MCSPCGRFVDRLRACYESDFCINAVTGETIRGRYYWADSGAQAIEGPHNFGSAVWLDPEDRGGLDYLGDQFTNVSEDDGERPRVRPLSRRSDLRKMSGCNPEPSRQFRLTTDTFGGLPRDCFRTDLLACLAYDDALDVRERTTWCFVAKVVKMLYDADAGVEDYVRTYLPDVDLVQTQLDGTGTLPQYIFWTTPCGRGAIFAGTNNFQQAALQVFYGINGPTSVGRYYTSLFWSVVAEGIRAAFIAFAGEHVRRTFLGGHSYGAAIAALLAAGESTRENVDEYRLVTLGGPRFGNGQVYQNLSAENSIFLQNEGDPVPSFPPSYPTLTDLLPIVGPLTYFFFQRWAPPPVQTVIRVDGTTYESNDWNGGAVAAAAIAATIRDRAIMPTFGDHVIEEYRRRICDYPATMAPAYHVSITGFRSTGMPSGYVANLTGDCFATGISDPGFDFAVSGELDPRIFLTFNPATSDPGIFLDFLAETVPSIDTELDISLPSNWWLGTTFTPAPLVGFGGAVVTIDSLTITPFTP